MLRHNTLLVLLPVQREKESERHNQRLAQTAPLLELLTCSKYCAQSESLSILWLEIPRGPADISS